MDKQIKARSTWVNLYLETKDAGYVCRKCGITRPTLRKWYRRYLSDGAKGLLEQSKKPHFLLIKKSRLSALNGYWTFVRVET